MAIRRPTAALPRTRKAKGLAAGLIVAAIATAGSTAQADTPSVRMDQGPGRHFFMFVGEPFVGSARILQSGTEIWTLPETSQGGKYTEQWNWYGHADEAIEVKIRPFSRAGSLASARTYGPEQTFSLDPSMNHCFRAQTLTDIVKVGDSITGDCTPD